MSKHCPLVVRFILADHGVDAEHTLALVALCEALCTIDQLQIKPGVPSLYTSGVYYKAEDGCEEWQDVETTLERRFGDCEDLACWRVAELRAQGIDAKPLVSWHVGTDPKTGKPRTEYHIRVLLPDGTIEDPSATLGMH